MKTEDNSRILSCLWDISFQCNLSCPNCFNGCGGDYAPGPPSDEAMSYLDVLAGLRFSTVMLSGGEPFLREDLIELVSHGAEKGLRMGVITNGTLCTENDLERLKPHLTILSVSLDATTETLNDSVRDKGSFEGALQTISIAKKINMPFFIYMTVQKSNLRHMTPMYELARRLGARGVYYKGIYRVEKEIFSISQLSEQIREILPSKDMRIDHSCMAYSKSLYLSPDGILYPCQMTVAKNERLSIGYLPNIQKGRFQLRLFGGSTLSALNNCPFKVSICGELNPHIILCSSPLTSCPFLD